MGQFKVISRPVAWLIWIYAGLYILGLLLVASSCFGQAFFDEAPPSIANLTPDCCRQAIQLQAKLDKAQAKLAELQADRDTLKAVGTRLMKAKDIRINLLETIGTNRIRSINWVKEKARKQAEAYLQQSSLLGVFYKKRLRAIIAILDTPE